jgi:hypothetical protein
MQIQAVNDVGNLVFFVFALGTGILTAVFAYRKLRHRQTRLGTAILMCFCAYIAILDVVSLTSETRQLALGTQKCFDDWCATVTGARSLPNRNGSSGTKLVAVTLRVSNRARQAAFRPSQPRVALLLATGGTVTSSKVSQFEFEKEAGPQKGLAARLLAGEEFQTTLVFDVPSAARDASVVLLEGPAILTRVLVGDENSFFHRKAVFPISFE